MKKNKIAEAVQLLAPEVIDVRMLAHWKAALDAIREPRAALMAVESMIADTYKINSQAGDRVDLNTGIIVRAKPAGGQQ